MVGLPWSAVHGHAAWVHGDAGDDESSETGRRLSTLRGVAREQVCMLAGGARGRGTRAFRSSFALSSSIFRRDVSCVEAGLGGAGERVGVGEVHWHLRVRVR